MIFVKSENILASEIHHYTWGRINPKYQGTKLQRVGVCIGMGERAMCQIEVFGPIASLILFLVKNLKQIGMSDFKSWMIRLGTSFAIPEMITVLREHSSAPPLYQMVHF